MRVALIGQRRNIAPVVILIFGYLEIKRKPIPYWLKKKIKIDKSHHHHTVFQWHEFIVENHYDFVNVYAHRSSSELEAVFKEAGRDKTCFVKVNGEKVYLPSYNLHALFLIKHMVSHFASEFITLRHILDWAFFAKRYSDKINWEWLQRILDDYHMKDFFNCINAICIEELGFESSIFPEVIFLPSLKDKIFIDVMNPQFTCEEPRGFFKRLLYKYKRWEKNAWKQKLCYKESRFETFLYGIWAHIIKPSSL